MTKELTAATFDYSSIDKDVKGKLMSALRDINREKAKHEESGMEIGKAIATAHALFAGDGGEGLFSQWVEVECGFSRSTAYNYMNVWQRFGNCPSLGQFTQEALYALASPKTPEPAVKEAMKLADKGVRVNKKQTDELLGKFREVNDKPKGKGKTSAPKKLPSQSDEPPTPAEDETPQGKVTKAVEKALEEAEPEEDLSFDDQVKQANKAIDDFCKSIKAFCQDNRPKVRSLTDSRFDSAMASVESACGTLRTCKYHKEPCPRCKGDGCKTCEKESDFGAVTATTYQQVAR